MNHHDKPDTSHLLSGDALEAFLQHHERIAAEARRASTKTLTKEDTMTTTNTDLFAAIIDRLNTVRKHAKPSNGEQLAAAYQQYVGLDVMEELAWLWNNDDDVRRNHQSAAHFTNAVIERAFTGASIALTNGKVATFSPYHARNGRFGLDANGNVVKDNL